jgi:hypothetical protein
MHEWLDVGKLVSHGGPAALICAVIGGVLAYVNTTEPAERFEHAAWGALAGIAVGILLGYVVITALD